MTQAFSELPVGTFFSLYSNDDGPTFKKLEDCKRGESPRNCSDKNGVLFFTSPDRKVYIWERKTNAAYEKKVLRVRDLKVKDKFRICQCGDEFMVVRDGGTLRILDLTNGCMQISTFDDLSNLAVVGMSGLRL